MLRQRLVASLGLAPHVPARLPLCTPQLLRCRVPHVLGACTPSAASFSSSAASGSGAGVESPLPTKAVAAWGNPDAPFLLFENLNRSRLLFSAGMAGFCGIYATGGLIAKMLDPLAIMAWPLVALMYGATGACAFASNLQSITLVRRIHLLPGGSHVNITTCSFLGLDGRTVRVPVAALALRHMTTEDGFWHVTLGGHKLAVRVAKDGTVNDPLLLDDVLHGKVPATPHTKAQSLYWQCATTPSGAQYWWNELTREVHWTKPLH